LSDMQRLLLEASVALEVVKYPASPAPGSLGRNATSSSADQTAGGSHVAEPVRGEYSTSAAQRKTHYAADHQQLG